MGAHLQLEARQSRSIASVRIRVENTRIKENKIFTETLCNRTSKRIVDDMIVVVCALLDPVQCTLFHWLLLLLFVLK